MKPDSTTTLFGVLGDPVGHSLSPVMHNTGFRAIGYNGVYLAFAVKDIAAAVTGIRALGIQGASVTIPHKVTVMSHLDHVDETALKIGAVNTIVNKNGKLYGYNTDYIGAIKALEEKTTLTGKKVAILGEGGAARAIGFGLQLAGAQMTIVARPMDQGEKLACEIGADYLPLPDFAKVKCDILINTTPLGMHPHTDIMPIPREELSPHWIVMDIVYNPLQTLLLHSAEALGCTTIDGAKMFVFQGVAQFEMWTGSQAPVAQMREVVLEALSSK